MRLVPRALHEARLEAERLAYANHLGQGTGSLLAEAIYHWQHEPCWYAVRGTTGTTLERDRKQSTLWTMNAREDDGHGHGTQKPVDVFLAAGHPEYGALLDG